MIQWKVSRWSDQEKESDHFSQKMLRFFSRRKPKGRRDQRLPEHKPLGPAPAKSKKNILPCRIVLLDGADLSIDISVRLTD